MQSGGDYDRATQRSNGHHIAAQSRIKSNMYHVASSDLNGERAENSGKDLGVAATGITYQDEVVCDDGGGIQIWAEVDVS